MRAAFTLIELLVVVSIIVIVLLIALPGMNAMTTDMRKNAAVQQIETYLARAQNLAIEKSTLTAVRFVPAAWDAATGAGSADLQRMVIYEYVGETQRWDGGSFVVEFNEFFKRAQGIEAVDLPEGTWVAPLESLARNTAGISAFTVPTKKPDASFVSPPNNVTNIGGLGQSFVLRGPIGQFAFDPVDITGSGYFNSGSPHFLNADDFLIVFDPRSGLLAGAPRTWRLLGFWPDQHQEVDRDDPVSPNQYMQRVAFGGVIIYPREQFLAATVSGDIAATATARQRVLADAGQAYAVTRFGGQLTDAGDVAP